MDVKFCWVSKSLKYRTVKKMGLVVGNILPAIKFAFFLNSAKILYREQYSV